jgi:hypothetical protein
MEKQLQGKTPCLGSVNEREACLPYACLPSACRYSRYNTV